MGQPEPAVWNGLFWTIQLFVCVNAVAKSFLQEGRGRMIYFYSLAGARQFIIAKLLFNVLLMMVMTLISLFLFRLLMGDPLEISLQLIGVLLFCAPVLRLVCQLCLS